MPRSRECKPTTSKKCKKIIVTSAQLERAIELVKNNDQKRVPRRLRHQAGKIQEEIARCCSASSFERSERAPAFPTRTQMFLFHLKRTVYRHDWNGAARCLQHIAGLGGGRSSALRTAWRVDFTLESESIDFRPFRSVENMESAALKGLKQMRLGFKGLALMNLFLNVSGYPLSFFYFHVLVLILLNHGASNHSLVTELMEHILNVTDENEVELCLMRLLTLPSTLSEVDPKARRGVVKESYYDQDDGDISFIDSD